MTTRLLADGILENYTGPGLGWIGGAVFTAIAVATILLVRNMNSRIRRLPTDFGDGQISETLTDSGASQGDRVPGDGDRLNT